MEQSTQETEERRALVWNLVRSADSCLILHNLGGSRQSSVAVTGFNRDADDRLEDVFFSHVLKERVEALVKAYVFFLEEK